MSDIDTVAEAIFRVCHSEWRGFIPRSIELRYRRMAQAAIDALQLTEDHGVTDWSTATGHVCTCDAGDLNLVDEFHHCERGEHGDESFPVIRLVSPWVRVEEQP